MKKRMMKTLVIALAAIMTLSCLGVNGVASDLTENRIMKVGLYYGSTALPTANLANEVGSGFRFGYFDQDGNFFQVGYTTVEAITMLKNTNFYLASGDYYETPTSSAFELIGAYHVQLSGTYVSFDDANRAAGQYTGGFPAYIDGKYVVRFGSFSSLDQAKSAAAGYYGAAAVGNSSTAITVTAMKTSRILFQFDSGGDTALGVMPSLGEVLKPVTWFKGYKYYGGFSYSRNSGGDLTVLNMVDIEDYVKGVVPYEMNASWASEALKAQAVCARTYAANSKKHVQDGFDVCNSTCCQVYRGVYSGDCFEAINQAVDSTSGLCIYYDGQLINAVYHSADGGATEDAKNAWGGDAPYLIGVIDTFENPETTKHGSWTYTFTLDDFTYILKNKGVECANIIDVYIESYTATGNVDTLVFVDSNGEKYIYTGDATRKIFENTGNGYYFSRHYTITPYSGAGTGAVTNNAGNSQTYLISGGGWGHNVGMSQWGAKAMADLNYTYDEIIRYYYTDVYIQ